MHLSVYPKAGLPDVRILPCLGFLINELADLVYAGSTVRPCLLHHH